MPYLKNRQKQIPGGMQFYDPVLKWKPLPWSSFAVVCSGLRSARMANPGVTRANKLATDLPTIEAEVEAYQVAVCQAHGYNDYLTDAPGGSAPAAPFPSIRAAYDRLNPQGRRSSLVQGAKNVVAGSEILVEWIASGAEAVPQEQASKRAEICSKCPLNGKGDWAARFTVPVANAIRKTLGAKREMKLETPFDHELGTCEACDCPMTLKVWVPFEKFFAKMPQSQKDALDPDCWIRGEVNK